MTAAQEPGEWTGALFAERYRVGRQLDRGGMGAVYEGVRVDTGARVAIKVLHPHLGEDRYHLTRFQREAEAAAMLGHPHIVRVMDFRAADNEPAYLVMEFLDGNSLSRIVKETGPLEQRRVATIGAQVLSALSAAHAAGIVHRDIKPSNIFLAVENGREVAKVVDFGIAKMMEGTGYTRMTATGALVGTPAYMPPEQALGKEVDGRADIYSLGATLFVALTARPPFTAPAFSELIMKILREPSPPIARFRPDIDPRLDAVIAQSLAKKPEERFQSADAMANALSPWVGSGAMPTMTLPASRQPPDTSDDFDSARTSALPSVDARAVARQSAAVAAVVEPMPQVRGATLATNEPRLSHPSAPAASLPQTAPAGARAPVALTQGASPDLGRAPVRGSVPSGVTGVVADASAAPAPRRSLGPWLLVGVVVVLVGLALGAGGAIWLSRRTAPAPSVASPPNQVQAVVAVPSVAPAKVDPRKPLGVSARQGTPDVAGVAVGAAAATDAPRNEHRPTERSEDDRASGSRAATGRSPGPSVTETDAVQPDEPLARVPNGTPTVASSTEEPERQPAALRGLDVDVRSETLGAPSPQPYFVHGIQSHLRGCAGMGGANDETYAWDVDVDTIGRPLAVRAQSSWPSMASCGERVLRFANFPAYSTGATYRVTLRLR